MTNPRLRALLADTTGRKAWQLLWLPPTLPYWRLEPPFADLAGLTKRLIFSAWAVVPKAIAALVSYEAERHIFRAAEPEPRNDPEERRRRQSRAPLQLTYSEGRLTGMPVLGLLYPSATLAGAFDLPTPSAETAEPPPLSDVLHHLTEHFRTQLQHLQTTAHASGPPDQAWYWAAPILLDLHHHREPTLEWLERSDLPVRWSGEKPRPGGGEDRWTDHVEEARSLARGERDLGPIPEDLAEVLARLTLGGPAVVALRSLHRIAPTPVSTSGDPPLLSHLDAAGQIAWGFRSLFNGPESVAILRAGDPDQVYWRRVLDYACAGCLPAVVDEYLHLLRDLLGLYDHEPEEVAAGLAESAAETLRLRTPYVEADDIRTAPNSQPYLDRRRLRIHFALPFGRSKGEDDGSELREDLVRAAFNSPFWPFVLASTSIGQEGLDFHPYCHAIVHWNLPSNPVDLEQREGRIHRFKGHAIRKNVAQQFGPEVLATHPRDPWHALFHLAERSVANNNRHGLVPYWLYTTPNGATIERYIPALPLSKDRLRAQALRRSLAAYRMVFGQPRQDDLLEFLLTRVEPEVIERVREHLRIDLSPSRASRSTGLPEY